MNPYTVVVLIPVYNDWIAVSMLLAQLDRVLANRDVRVRVLLVDDGSSEPYGRTFDSLLLNTVEDVQVLSLRRNLGHQRAIAIGLAWLEHEQTADAVVIMDGDGEDDPADVSRLIDRCRALGNSTIVFAERTRRVDSLMFRVLYACYRGSHWILTGIKVRVGNFSIIPRQVLSKLVTVSELWNHYAAAVYAAKLPRDTIETTRRPRLHGRSKMNFASLVGHGLSAMSVHGEILAVRVFFASAFMSLVVVIGLLLALTTARGLTTAPASALLAGGMLALGSVAGLTGIALVLALRTLQGRAASGFLPLRDYRFFVDTVVPLRVGAAVSDHTLPVS